MGRTLSLVAEDDFAASVVETLSAVMRMTPASRATSRRILRVSSYSDRGANAKAEAGTGNVPAEGRAPCGESDTDLTASGQVRRQSADGAVMCRLSVRQERVWLLRQLSLTIAQQTESLGGALLHGALVCRDGQGVVLAGRHDVGKTTAARRIVPPWRALSDDAVLLLPDHQGTYWAHPWPTWSRLTDGGTSESWDVQQAVPLRGVFVLRQAPDDRADRLGVGHAVCALVPVAHQPWLLMKLFMTPEERRVAQLQRFENVCALARDVPAYTLRLSLAGRFWEEIERVLAEPKERKTSET